MSSSNFSPPASVPDAHISTKPVASSLSPTWMTPSTTTSPYISPTETMATMTTSNTVPTAPTTVPATARNSVDSNALPVYPEFSHLRISSKQQLPSVGSNTSNRSQQDNTSWVTNKKVPFFTSPPSAPSMTQANHLTPWEKLADNRSPSPSHPPSMASRPQSTLLPLSAASSSYDRLRCASAQPLDGAGSWMHGISADQEVNRAVSNPIDTSRLYPPQQESSCLSPQTDSSASGTTEKRKSRMSWLPGGRSRSNSVNQPRTTTGAWLLTPESREQSDGQQQQKSVIEYSPAPLLKGEKVPELWDEMGNVYVYVHPKESGKGPCFKVPDHILASSATLTELLVTEMMATRGSLYTQDDPDTTSPKGHLYLSLGNTDVERLIDARNLFAFLLRKPLVATPKHPDLFTTVLQVAGLLRRFNFCNYDGSSFGDFVDEVFDVFIVETGIADVRNSREKTLQALILAEQMKSFNLYNEAFAHAVGKYESLLELKSPLFERISASTRQRLDRAHMDLVGRQQNAALKLEEFEFPSLFAGVASSTSHEEFRHVRFKEWRSSFHKMRSFVLGYYKTLFGSWPPRARSKRNPFSQSGLNRLALKILYSDLCALYDLLVDRTNLTPQRRSSGSKANDEGEKGSGDKEKEKEMEKEEKENERERDRERDIEANLAALRAILSEFDKSSPPVLPRIPFDVPKLPSMTALYENYRELPTKKQAKYSKSLQPHELQLLLIKSHNIDTDSLEMPFLTAFKEFELREARSASHSHIEDDLIDQRIGTWLFLYVVIQSLPMLVVDAPGLRYGDGVEYFLCEAPQGNPPWTEDRDQVRKMWYQTADQALVELSTDVVMFSVEGIYIRSHCWLAAKEWQAQAEARAASAGAVSVPVTVTQPDWATSTAITTEGAFFNPLQPPSQSIFHNADPFQTQISSSSPSPPPQHPQRHKPTVRPISTGPELDNGNGNGLLSPPLANTSLGGLPMPMGRPRAGSTHDRARQAFRASIAIGLEPIGVQPLPQMAAPLTRSPSPMMMLGQHGQGAGDSHNGEGVGIMTGVVGNLAAGQAGDDSNNSWGTPDGAKTPMVRASRSGTNLNLFGGNSSAYMGEVFPPAPAQPWVHQHQRNFSGPVAFPMPTPSSYHQHAKTSSLGGGGSTFDDILKGMDDGGKKKKRFFF